VGLLFRFHLQPVLDLAEEAIAATRSTILSAGSVRVPPGHAKPSWCLFLQESVAATVNELERLDNDSISRIPPRPSLTSRSNSSVPRAFAFYPAFDLCDFIEQIGVGLRG